MLKFNPEIEPHEVLLDRLAKKNQEILGITEKKFEPPILEKNLIFFLIFLFFPLCFLYARTFYLQVVKEKELKSRAQKNQYLSKFVQAQRGVIYDRNFEQLVFNVPKFDLVLDKTKLPKTEKEIEKILNEISKILGLDQNVLKEKLKEPAEKIKIFENLDIQKLLVIEAKREEFYCLEIETEMKRNYLNGEVFSHVIGYLGKIDKETQQKEPEFYSISDFVGKAGLEQFYEKILRKNPGRVLIERDVRGNVLSEKVLSLPESGKNLVLWLDSKLQKKIKEEVEKKMKEIGAKGGAAVAINPNTGGILALVSLPSFDNNHVERYLENPQGPIFNRAVAGQYLLGSTIKPFVALAALQEKIIYEKEKIDCKGKVEIPHRYDPTKIYTFGDWTAHGITDVRKAIAESCNVFFYTIGKNLGPKRIKKYLEEFGFGKEPEIDFPSVSLAKGFLPDPEWKKEKLGQNWWDGDTLNFSIGQGYILATPLQVAKAFSAIANGGKLLKPKFVWKIVDENKNLIEEIKPEVEKENFLDERHIQIVREGMRQAVTGENAPRATAVLLRDLPVSAAAKTGTAQVPKKDCPDCYNIWISVFAPYENPEIVLVLVLEDVPRRLSGVIVPVAKEILNWYFSKQ